MTYSYSRFTQFLVWVIFLILLTYCACVVEARLMRTLVLESFTTSHEVVDKDALPEY